MITGRCYCGRTRIRAQRPPQVVTYCHCSDCRRSSGAPVAAFAGFAVDDLSVEPTLTKWASAAPGAKRWFCPNCGSPIAAEYDYLPGQIYVSLGLLDQAEALEPQGHAHAEEAIGWLHIEDDLPRQTGSARETLKR